MSMVTNEFFCPECHKYFLFSLSLTLNQNYRIHCPNCGHTHYRKVENGYITEIRIMDNLGQAFIADIRPLKASLRDSVTDDDRESYYYHRAGEGFLYRLWKEFKGHLV
jgi:transcription elongation factor Elf1